MCVIRFSAEKDTYEFNLEELQQANRPSQQIPYMFNTEPTP